MREKKPPEKLVKALKNNPKVDNPYALANWLKNANTASAISQLLRSGPKVRCSIDAAVVSVLREASKDTNVMEGPIVKVVLITEGLGNRHDMNYYSPESIASAPAIFEGKSCFIDHPTDSEQRDIPERHVRSKCGYFKNCATDKVDGLVACVGELHFDLSEDGTQAYLKACTALHYKTEFPGLDAEYVGLSIAADGDRERRRIQWEGETVDVNYVVRFTDAVSCDIVTSPARGGRFLALVESAAGANPNKEGQMNKKLNEALKAAQTALAEAVKETDLKAKADKLTEADKLFNAFLAEAMKSATKVTTKKETYKEESGEEDDAESSESEEESGEEEDESEDDAKKTKDGEDEDEDAVESKRVAIRSIAKESGIEIPSEYMPKLMKLTLKEAKAEISGLRKMVESAVKQAVIKAGVPAAHYAKLSEAERKTKGEKNNDLFVDLVR